MDLAELKFKVNTDELENAAGLIKVLGDEITKLNTVQKTSTAIAKDEAQAEKVRIKTQTELVALKQKLADAEDKSAKAQEKNSRAAREATTETDKLQGLVGKLTNKWQDMAAGSTSAEASVLNLARSLGATSNDALAPVRALLENIRNLSKSPFDSAIGSIRSITQEMNALNQRSDLAAKGIFLTGQQLKEYSKIANEVQGQFATLDLNPFEGEGLTRATAEIEKQQKEYLGIVQTVNTLKAAEADRSAVLLTQQKQIAEIENMRQKAAQDLFTNNRLRQTQDEANYKQDMRNMSAYYSELERNQSQAQQTVKGVEQPMDQANALYQKENARAIKESSSAAAYLEKEMKRVDFVLSEVNAELQLSTSNRLLKFEESLKRTGVTGTQAATKIEAYRQSLQKIDETRAFKRQTDDLKAYQEKVDYVTRAVGPQLTDIFSGLLTGQQSLYTIAVQQGGQLADQFSLAGIEANKMGGILASALPNMLTNITNIGKAFGQMAIGGLIQTGQGLIDLTLKATFLKKTFDDMSFAMAIMADTGDEATLRIYQGMLLAAKGTALFAGLLSATVIGAVVALGVALYQVIKQEDEFARTMALSGASLGMSQQAAIAYARSLNDVGVSTSKALDVMSAMVKEGGFVKSEIELVTKSAVDMQKYAGVSIEDTVKAFAKLKDKPVEALTEVAAATGKIAPAVITAVSALMEQGRTAEAVSLAMRTLAEANNQSVNQIKADYSAFGSWIIEWGSSISNAWSNLFKNIMYKSSPEAQLREAIVDLEAKASSAGGQLFKAEYDAKVASLKEQLKLMTSASAKTEEYTANQVKGAKEALKQSKATEDLNKMLLGQGKQRLSQADYVNQKIAEYTKGQGLATLSTENLAKATKAFNQEWKDAQSKPTANPTVKLLNQDLEKLTDIKNKALGLNKDYNNSEQTLVRLLNQGHLNLVEYTLAMADLNAQQPRAIKATADQAKAQNELTAAWKKTNEEQLKLDIDYFKDSAETVKQRQELELQSKEIEFQLSIVGKSEEQQKQLTREFQKQTKLRSAQVELERELKEIEQKYGGSSEGGSLVIDAYAKNAEKIKAINAGVALEFALDMQREFDSIKATITDAVVTALFDGGKAGSKKLRDAIVAQFRKKITVVVDAVVNTALNSGLSALGLGGKTQAGSGSLAGSLSDLTSVMGAGVQAITGSLAGASTASLLGANAVGALGGDALGAMIAGNAGWAGVSTAATAGTTGAIGSAAGAGSGLLSSVSAALPYVGLALGAVSLLGSLFGSDKPKIQGTGEAGLGYSATGQRTGGDYAYAPYGGLTPSALANIEMLQGGYSAQAKALGIGTTAKQFTYGGNVMSDGSTPNFLYGVNSSGGSYRSGTTSVSEANMKLEASRVIFAALSGSDLPKYLQGAFDNLSAGSMTQEQLDSWFTGAAAIKNFNDTLVAGPWDSLKSLSFDAITNLGKVSNGLDNFVNSLQSFYENFYTQEEQTANLTNKTTEAFVALGIVMPEVNADMRSWYREVVNTSLALDQGVIANAKATAGILSLQGAVNELAPTFDEIAEQAKAQADAAIEQAKAQADAAIEQAKAQADAAIEQAKAQAQVLADAKEAAEDQAKALTALLTTASDTAYSQLERSVKAEKRMLQSQLDIASTRESLAQKSVDSLQEIFNVLKQAVKELYQEVDSTAAMQLQQAQGVIGSAVRSGSVKDIDELKDAIDTVRSSLDGASYKTKVDQDRARLLLANDLAKLQASTEVQLSNAENLLAEAKEQVGLLQGQSDALDDILTVAKEQIDEVRNLSGAVLSVKDAISALTAALSVERSNIASNAAAPLAAQQVQAVNTIFPDAAYSTQATSGVTTREQEIAKLYQTILGRSAETSGLQAWAGSALSIADISAGISSSLEAQARLMGVDVQNSMIQQVSKSLGLTTDIKAFANGGSYKGGLALVGETGPELINFSQPGQVYTAGQTSSLMNGGSRLEELVIKLNENIEGLRFEVRADVTHNSKIAKILDRVSPNGQSLSVTVLA